MVAESAPENSSLARLDAYDTIFLTPRSTGIRGHSCLHSFLVYPCTWEVLRRIDVVIPLQSFMIMVMHGLLRLLYDFVY